jgi:hypothetical protein
MPWEDRQRGLGLWLRRWASLLRGSLHTKLSLLLTLVAVAQISLYNLFNAVAPGSVDKVNVFGFIPVPLYVSFWWGIVAMSCIWPLTALIGLLSHEEVRGRQFMSVTEHRAYQGYLSVLLRTVRNFSAQVGNTPRWVLVSLPNQIGGRPRLIYVLRFTARFDNVDCFPNKRVYCLVEVQDDGSCLVRLAVQMILVLRFKLMKEATDQEYLITRAESTLLLRKILQFAEAESMREKRMRA